MAQYQGLPWRFIFTDLNTVTTTWADGLLTNRTLTFNIDQPAQIAASVYPDDPRVNLLFTDGYPLVAQSNRLVYAFRREAPVSGSSPLPPWVCRGAGLLMQPEDEADSDIPLTNFTAFDPWALMAAWPVWQSGGLPGPQGFNYLGPFNGTYWALNVYMNALLAIAAGQWGPTPSFSGNGSFIDAGDGSRSGEGPQYQNWGGTSFYQGVLELTPPITLSLTSGNTVADVWTQLCDAGNCDIVLTPIYDPINRPGYTHELNIYNLAGCQEPNAIFSWAMLRRNLKRIDRMHDATPGGFANLGLYFGGAGGNVPTPFLGPLIPSPANIETFGPYWSTQFSPNQTDLINPAAILQLLQQSLAMAKQGKRTLTMDPIPERSPIPLLDYHIGDRVPVYAPAKLRVTSAGFQRVQTIPVVITDDGIEEIVGLVTSPDWRQVGSITATELGDGGSGYTVGDTGIIDTGNQAATYIVTAVSGGAVMSYNVVSPGDGYSVSSGVTTETGGAFPGSGTGFTISITAVDPVGICEETGSGGGGGTPAPRITYAFDGVSTLVVTIDTTILVGLAADDLITATVDDGTSEGVGWPAELVTSDPVGTYGASLVLTVTGIAYDGGTNPNYFVTPRTSSIFRASVLVPSGTDAAGGAALPDLSTFARIGSIHPFSYGLVANAADSFSALPLTLPLTTGGGGGGGGGGAVRFGITNNLGGGGSEADVLTLGAKLIREDTQAGLAAVLTWAASNGIDVIQIVYPGDTPLAGAFAHEVVGNAPGPSPNEPYWDGVDPAVWAPSCYSEVLRVQGYGLGKPIIIPLVSYGSTAGANGMDGNTAPGNYKFPNGNFPINQSWVSQINAAAPSLLAAVQGFSVHPYFNTPPFHVLDVVRAELTALGYNQQFWITESGMYVGGGETQADQSTVFQAEIAAAQARTDLFCYVAYRLQASTEGSAVWGILNPDGSERLAYPFLQAVM